MDDDFDQKVYAQIRLHPLPHFQETKRGRNTLKAKELVVYGRLATKVAKLARRDENKKKTSQLLRKRINYCAVIAPLLFHPIRREVVVDDEVKVKKDIADRTVLVEQQYAFLSELTTSTSFFFSQLIS